jgi:hypothetical protein
MRPAMASVFVLSRMRPTTLVTTAMGGTTKRRVPPRNPSDDPHPKPGTPIMAQTATAHGARAKPRAIRPILMGLSSPCPIQNTA